MRRLLFIFAAALATCMLAACGNKGPLYRPAAAPAASVSSAAPASSVDTPAPAASIESGNHAG